MQGYKAAEQQLVDSKFLQLILVRPPGWKLRKAM
jgi:hypothetical protein